MSPVVPAAPRYPSVPYGRASFPSVRRDSCLYVDKTSFIRQLENERYVFFIRPRRFGKTFWLATLECYYDRRQKDAFGALFANTDIGQAPTPNRNRYVILYFDFSAFDNTLATLEERFQGYCATQVAEAVEAHPDLFAAADARRILAPAGIDGKLNELFRHIRGQGVPLYILIDEYDNFANNILAAEGPDAYRAFTHGGGFYRGFFATLKAGTARAGCVERLFVTGVSPITMDDVTSGFNIGANISLLPEYNQMLGFTEAEVRSVLTQYRDLGVFDQDIDAALGLMSEWHNGYRFSEDAVAEVYNTDLVLHYLHQSVPNKPGPYRLIDANVRMDYAKLRHLLLTGRRLNGNFDLLRDTIEDGQADCAIVDSFPQSELTRRENFLSLLHYFGLLSIRGARAGTAQLGIPNQTVRQLLYGYLRGAYEDAGVFSPDLLALERVAWRMALEGEWRPFVERLGEAVAEQTGIRDYMQGEKVVQSFLAAYVSVAGHFVVYTEVELGKGYADIVLAPLTARFPDSRHGFVIEVKYLRRGSKTPERVTALAEQAERQLRGYLADRRLEQTGPGVRFHGIALVFHGWELAHSAEVAPPVHRDKSKS